MRELAHRVIFDRAKIRSREMTRQHKKRQYRISVGVIEGFFGKTWTWDARATYAEFPNSLGFQFFIYAPKQDRFLRQRWREASPAATTERAAAIGRIYRKSGLSFGIGLSPFELHRDDEADKAAALRRKTRELNQVEPRHTVHSI